MSYARALRAPAWVAAAALLLCPQRASPRDRDPEQASLRAQLAAREEQLRKSPDDLKAGAEYRQIVIQTEEYDRAIKFFDGLVGRNPRAPNAYINFGLAYVDKIPYASGFAQPFLGKYAISQFGRALRLEPSWLAYYLRGLIYLYYRPFLGVTDYGVADLERALALQKKQPRRPYHVKTYIALGDGYWKMNKLSRARQTWNEGAALYPDNVALSQRREREGDALRKLVEGTLDADVRIDTSLADMPADPAT
jgi:tetratricopeptide (TPR) repeat protein